MTNKAKTLTINVELQELDSYNSKKIIQRKREFSGIHSAEALLAEFKTMQRELKANVVDDFERLIEAEADAREAADN